MYRKKELDIQQMFNDLCDYMDKVEDEKERKKQQEEERKKEHERQVKRAKRNRNLVVPPESAYESGKTLGEWIDNNSTEYDTLVLISKLWDKTTKKWDCFSCITFLENCNVLEVWKVTKGSFYKFSKNGYNWATMWRKRTRVPFELPAEAAEMLNRRSKPGPKKPIAYFVPDRETLLRIKEQFEYIKRFGQAGDIFIWSMRDLSNREYFRFVIDGIDYSVDCDADVDYMIGLLKRKLDITVVISRYGYLKSNKITQTKVSDFNIKSKTPKWTDEDYAIFRDEVFKTEIEGKL